MRSPEVLIYRRETRRFGPLREALARGGFRAVAPPDPIAEWECIDDRGTRVRGAAGLVLVEARDAAEAARFDARHREAFPSDRDVPDGGAPPRVVAAFAGSDEAGKGDRRQALVVAAVAVPRAMEEEALARGVRDSKRCAAGEVEALSAWIRGAFACEVRAVGPDERADALRAHGGNESRLLSSMHAACLGALWVRGGWEVARVDRFAPGRPVARALAAEWGEAVVVDECAGGERHVAVAAASIVARSRARPGPTGARHVPCCA